MRREAIVKGKYRYSLIREWDPSNPKRVVFVMLNPSTADHEEDDHTTKVCTQFAQNWGFGSLEFVNLFAHRASVSDSLKLIKSKEILIGPENDFYLKQALDKADKIVVAWGEHGKMHKRYKDTELGKLLSNYELYCLGILKQSHQPKHPLGVSYTTPLEKYPFYETKRDCLSENQMSSK